MVSVNIPAFSNEELHFVHLFRTNIPYPAITIEKYCTKCSSYTDSDRLSFKPLYKMQLFHRFGSICVQTVAQPAAGTNRLDCVQTVAQSATVTLIRFDVRASRLHENAAVFRSRPRLGVVGKLRPLPYRRVVGCTPVALRAARQARGPSHNGRSAGREKQAASACGLFLVLAKSRDDGDHQRQQRDDQRTKAHHQRQSVLRVHKGIASPLGMECPSSADAHSLVVQPIIAQHMEINSSPLG